MKRLLTMMMVVATAVAVAAATDYATISTRARRFVDQQEWNSAQAMYELMIAERPADAVNYGTAITIAGIRGDTVQQSQLLRQSLSRYIPIDSIVEQVRRSSFALCHASVYEQFLYRAIESQPWMRRTIDAYLMRYYAFRRDPQMMIRYSEKMLQGLPDDIGFLTTLAQGQMQAGLTDEALATYRRILQIAPDNYNALLEIGNFGAMYWDSSTAAQRNATLEALRRAAELRPTPFVDNLISKLTKQI